MHYVAADAPLEGSDLIVTMASQLPHVLTGALPKATVNVDEFPSATDLGAPATEQGSGLGRRTMPETLHYSAAMSIHTFWLAARMYGLGLGWISILDPDEVRTILDVPSDWQFIGYLCVGYPVEDHLDPELERAGWQSRTSVGRKIIQR